MAWNAIQLRCHHQQVTVPKEILGGDRCDARQSWECTAGRTDGPKCVLDKHCLC